MKSQDVGKFGEWVAAAWLKRRGYAILEHNFRCRMGEVDLIAAKGGQLVFVEVKTRQGELFGRPALAVDRRKQERMWRTASLYLQQHKIRDIPLRFDVVEISLEHLKGVLEC